MLLVTQLIWAYKIKQCSFFINVALHVALRSLMLRTSTTWIIVLCSFSWLTKRNVQVLIEQLYWPCLLYRSSWLILWVYSSKKATVKFKLLQHVLFSISRIRLNISLLYIFLHWFPVAAPLRFKALTLASIVMCMRFLAKQKTSDSSYIAQHKIRNKAFFPAICF